MNFSSVDVIWTLLGAATCLSLCRLVLQCVRPVLTRAKNTGNILMKNMMDFCIGTPASLAGRIRPDVWRKRYFYRKTRSADPRKLISFGSLPTWCFVIFQTVFCATSATIVSGSMAERTNFKAYCLYSAMISLIVYPISGHWIWGGGWLSQLGFHDFAGSTAVHMVGGVCRLHRCKNPWSSYRKIRQRRKTKSNSRSQPDRCRTRCLHPLVLLVRI